MRSQECWDCMCVHAHTLTKQLMENLFQTSFWIEQFILALLEKQFVQFIGITTLNLRGQETLAIYTCRHNDFETKILQITDLLPH